MPIDRTNEYLQSLLTELIKLPKETGCVEFKMNDDTPDDIGQYISALSNTATLIGKAQGYVVWGIEDSTHNVLGTTFQPSQATVGNEELENWLLKLLSPRPHFQFNEFTYDEKRIVLLEIPRASNSPVQFKNDEFIRVGSYRKKLKDFPEKERELWRIFDQTPFEEQIAAENVDSSEVLSLIDYPSFFDLQELPLPENREAILSRLEDDRMVVSCDGGRWHITNLGAVLFAKSLRRFRHLGRKAIRVVVYEGNSKVETQQEQSGVFGYASGFERLIRYINGLLPTNEVLGQAIRRKIPMYPKMAVRELVANAIIHQDFSITGAGPMIEIFSDRMEVSNPGKPLVETDRFLDSPPRSRNEILASFMRRIGVCEERGSGIDKVVIQTELFQLPAPVFEAPGDNTRAVLFAYKPFSKMSKQEKIHACYLHACLRRVNRDFLTNSSVRERFRIEAKNKATSSRIIRDTVEAKLIRRDDPENASDRYARYVPFWS